MKNTIKKIIFTLTILILGLGVYFGYSFFQKSKTLIKTNGGDVTNIDRNRTPFQTRVSTSTNVETFANEEVVENPTETASEKPRLIQLWNEPVSGFDFVYKDIEVISTSTNKSTSTKDIVKDIINKKILKNQEYIYFWDRKTGHIYENIASTTDIVKISNYTSPGAEEVFFADSSSLIIRTLANDNETISTAYMKLIKEFSSSTIYKAEVKNINIDANNISFLGSIKKIFYFINKSGGGVVSNIDGVVRINTINTTISEWLSQYVNKTVVALTTKPSAYFKGYLFTLNPDGNSKNTYILGEKYGFNTLMSPDGKKVIYNEILNNTLETFIYDIKAKNSTYLNQATIVDKCVWGSDSKIIYCGIPQRLEQAPYPDAWYKNNISFGDNIWSIDAETGGFRLIVSLQDQVIVPIDIYKMNISSTNKYLLFQDKETLTLWKYDL